MDQEIREALKDIHDDIKALLPMKQMVDRHDLLLYGNGQPGLLANMESVKTRNKVYDKLFAGVGALLAAVFGDAFWRHVK